LDSSEFVIKKPIEKPSFLFVNDKFSPISPKEEETLHDFCYLELTAFPTRIKENTFGIAIGYRVSHGERSSTDFSFHVLKNQSKDIIFCGKTNHLYYISDKQKNFAHYVGFGFILGLAPPHGDLEYINSHYIDASGRDKDKEYTPFMNGEVVLGCEYAISTKKQFFELTYFARSTTLQISLGIGL
jgi:hypothetical protein